MKTIKGAWKSLTIWFNCVLLGLLPLFDMVMASLPQLREYLPTDAYKTLGLAALVGNILLRFKTNKPLNEK